MRIGLARHFQIPHEKGKFLDTDGYSEWVRWYDASHGPHCPTPRCEVAWHKCYCSDIPRAKITAGIIYAGPTEESELLREVPLAPLLRTRLPLPVWLWQSLSRVGWWLEHASQPETRSATRKRAARILEWIRGSHSGEDILLVSHGFLMQFLERELIKAGFAGRVPLHPKGGHIYVFEARA